MKITWLEAVIAKGFHRARSILMSDEGVSVVVYVNVTCLHTLIAKLTIMHKAAPQ
jgi:O-methyltransferase involved in polyketide biosynthesis